MSNHPAHRPFRRPSGKSILIFILVIVLILVACNFFMNQANKTNTSRPSLFERKANSDDISIEPSYKFPVSINITVTPNVNIQDLELRLDFYNKSGKIVYTKFVNYGNVFYTRQYTESISLFDLDISIIATDSVIYSVSRGTVGFF